MITSALSFMRANHVRIHFRAIKFVLHHLKNKFRDYPFKVDFFEHPYNDRCCLSDPFGIEYNTTCHINEDGCFYSSSDSRMLSIKESFIFNSIDEFLHYAE